MTCLMWPVLLKPLFLLSCLFLLAILKIVVPCAYIYSEQEK